MNPKHTSGPWYVTGANIRSDAHKDGGLLMTVMPIAAEPSSRGSERYANLRLACAAPELLAALEIMVRAFNTDEIDPLVAFASIEKARAAIAKARGEL